MLKGRIILVLALVLSFSLQAQKNNGFSSLSGPEKWWVIVHPFKAKKALETSLRTIQVRDSIKSLGIIGSDDNGGHLDAFKHTLWMVGLTHKIGPKSAIKLGKAHEKGNYKSYLKGDPEDGALPDKAASDMDLFNNEQGIRIASDNPQASEARIIAIILDELQTGSLRILKKEGRVFLNCDGLPLAKEDMAGTWENDKCLVSSDSRNP
ncbi:DUF6973 domain-containing protein [Lutimonas zeaxanthinifaciens]|uniref:DUF6973 domain-containing protein n=1 Tax=Lutimonas zeaxanthinifaciens TaxID=3060215 RepID=UPI00265CA108|nr:hypothetical protein [Lutimonas sp. YSD2104]WKK66413.1 hypothetical protein QZH61_02055 [Lutimonas sp. YSD2104]